MNEIESKATDHAIEFCKCDEISAWSDWPPKAPERNPDHVRRDVCVHGLSGQGCEKWLEPFPVEQIKSELGVLGRA